jgi:signal peptidase II
MTSVDGDSVDGDSVDGDSVDGDSVDEGTVDRVARLTWVASLAVAAVVVAVDQVSKSWARRDLTTRDIDLFWTLRFHLSFNSGMAFGRGRGLGPVIGVVALVVVVGLLVSLRTAGSALATVAVGLVVGGAVGNVIDRMFRAGDGGFLGGHVVDFIDPQWWPIFNVADSAVVIGGALLVVGSRRRWAS